MKAPQPTFAPCGAFATGVRRSARRGFVSLLLVALITPVLAQNGDDSADTNRALGLRPPSAAERAWMEREMRITERVWPNKLAIERLNRERQAKGLRSINVPVVPNGEEVGTSSSGSQAGEDSLWLLSSPEVATSGGTVGLAASVDNSTLPSFPPVRDQGQSQSCASFSTGYYVGTHMLGLARGLNTTSASDNSNKLSPKWLYALVNDGQDGGSWFTSNLDVLLKLGAPSWQLYPYVGSPSPASNFREWSRDAAVWRAAVFNRFREAGRITGVDTQAGLNSLKALLANGYIVLYATDIFGWQFTTFANDPATTADNALAGREVCWKVNVNNSGHAMTIVGYNDDVWTDINRNGVVNPGEKGALKIVNSWGTRWKDGGFSWIAYDALRATSAVPGADNSGRASSGWRRAFWYNEVYWIAARASYTPALLAEFTLSHARRSDLELRVGSSPTTTSTPQSLFPVAGGFDGWSNASYFGLVFRRLGGGFAFDGGSAALSGTFVFDLTDVLRQGAARYYLVATDSAAGSPCTVTAFKLTSSAGQTLATASAGLPASVDARSQNFSVDFNRQSSSAPVITSASAASATVGQPFSFQISASNSPNSYSATGLPPGVVFNSSTGAITGTPTQPGTFNATVSASNSAGTGSAVLTITVATRVPQITSAATAAGTVGQAFSYQIAASESPTRYAASPLPPGTAVNPDTGLVSGTPNQAGTFEMIVSAANAAGTGNRKVTVTIAPPIAAVPVITSAENIGGTSGSAFSYRIEASNSPTSFGADNLPGTLSINGSTGQISGTLPSARTYYITLRASNAAGTGYRTLVLNVTGEAIVGPPNDALANAIVLTGANPPQAEGNNRQATKEDGEPSHAGHTSHSVWWVWTAPRSGVVTISTAGSNFDTVLAAYTGVSLPALTKVAENDDSVGTNTSRVEFTATAGTAYKIAVDGFGSAVGDIKLLVQQAAATAPGNDLFANRSNLSGPSFTVKASNAGATPENGEPNHAGFAAAKSVWWSWTAPSNGRVTLDTKGSAFDTLLAIYTGASIAQLTPVASDDQSGGNNTSLAVFSVVQGTTYQFAVDGCRGEEGGITLNLLLEQITGPVNDNFSLAHNLTGNSGSDIKSSANATAQAGEPAHAGSGPARSIWWKWTAPSSGTVRVDTDESNFDTVLGVYTGNSVAALTLVASDDDSGNSNASKVEFPAVQGTTYYIAVDGFGGVAGDVKLSFAFAGASGNDNFASAALIAGASATVSGSNANATRQTNEPAHAGSPAARSLWWKWTPTRSASVLISTAGSNFDTVLAVYTGSSVSALNALASNDDSGWSSTSQVAFFANAGTTYYLAVDGFGGASGRIQLALDQAEEGVLYETDFEDFPLGIDGMRGVDGWIVGDPESGSCGIFRPDGTNKAAWLGYNAPFDDAAYISRPVDYRPGANDEGVVVFAVDVEVVDSTDANRDFFAFDLYNISNQLLGSVIFDNDTGEILIYEGWRPQGERIASTGIVFDTLDPRQLKITYDLKRARWSASWGDDSLFRDRTLGAPGADLSVGSVDAVWYPANQGSPGDNFLILDNYSLSTRALQVPVITSAGSAAAVRGQSFSYQITANNNPTSFAATGLPDGLSIDSSTGRITGAPQVAGSYAVLVSAGNSAGSGTKTLLLSVSAPPAAPTITSATSAAGKSAQPISYQITADNTPTSFGATGLPEGLTIDINTGLISGSVAQPGNYVFFISASNAVGSGSATLRLTVSGDAPLEQAPVITSALSASGQVGSEFSYLIVASNSPTSFTTSSSLPPGLSLDSATGRIAGVPLVSGSYAVSLGAVNAVGVGTAPLIINVSDRPIVSPPSYGSPKQPKKKFKPKKKPKPKKGKKR